MELSKTTFGNIFKFFTIRGDSYGQKVTRSGKKVEKKKKKEKKEKKHQGEKWNKKIGGRSCFITRGAFGHGLGCRAS